MPPAREPAEPGDIVDRASAGARLLTSRGVAIRLVSVASNFALIALVAPAQLGLWAVVRGITALVGNTADLGFAWALLRRERAPSREEYSALVGVQLAVVAAVFVVVAVNPSILTGLGSVPAEWHSWMLMVLATTVTVPFGVSARIRIERKLDYRWIAFYDLSSVLLQNAILLAFALASRFAVGAFVATGVAVLYSNIVLWIRSPGPGPSFRLASWRRLGGEFAGFSLAHLFSVLYASATPILVANLFGLTTAGIWALAARLGNTIQVAFEGFRRAAVPAGALLTRSTANLRRLAEDSLLGAARLTLPLVAAVYAGLPLIGLLWPRWAPAVGVGQLYALGFGVSGLISASLVPVAVARRGAPVVIAEQLVPMVVGWSGFAILARLGSQAIEWVVLPMFAALVVAIWLLTERPIRPRWHRALGRHGFALAGAICLTEAGSALGAPPLGITMVAGLTFAAIWLAGTPGRRRLRPQQLPASEPDLSR